MLPTARGTVFVAGIGQGTTDLSLYQARLQDWYEDAAFWSDLSRFASDWSQEVYGDVRNYAVAGASREARRDRLNEYLQHQTALAGVAPPSADAARSFLAAFSSPLANAAWRYDAAFGWTDVPVELMEDYASAQTYAMRSAGHGPLRLCVGAEEPGRHPGGRLQRADRRAARPPRRRDRRLGRHPGSRLRRELVHRQPRRRGGDGRLEHVRSLEALAPRVHVAGADGGAGRSVDAADRRAPDERRHGLHGRRPGRRRAFVVLTDSRALGEPRRTLGDNALDAHRLRRDARRASTSGTPPPARRRSPQPLRGRRLRRRRSPSAPLPRLRRTPSGGGGPAPDLVVQASATPAAPTVGGAITYTVTVRNLGGPAARALLAVQLPTQVAYAGSQSDRGPGCTGTTTLSCDLDFLAGDLVATVRISGVVREAGTLAFAAVSSAQPADPQPANDTARVSTVVGPRAAVGSPTIVRPTLRAVGAPTRPTRAHGVATVSVRFSVGGSARLEGRLTTTTSTRPLTLLAGSSLAGVRSTKARPTAAARVSRAGAYVFKARVGAAKLIRGRTYLARLTVIDADGTAADRIDDQGQSLMRAARHSSSSTGRRARSGCPAKVRASSRCGPSTRRSWTTCSSAA